MFMKRLKIILLFFVLPIGIVAGYAFYQFGGHGVLAFVLGGAFLLLIVTVPKKSARQRAEDDEVDRRRRFYL